MTNECQKLNTRFQEKTRRSVGRPRIGIVVKQTLPEIRSFTGCLHPSSFQQHLIYSLSFTSLQVVPSPPHETQFGSGSKALLTT